MPTKLPLAALLAALAAAAAGCGGCQPDKVPEPAPAPAPTASARRPVDPREARERKMHVPPETCSEAAKKFNELNGREPFDKKGINVITLCLGNGNVAWYRCVSDAKTAAEGRDCNERLLGPGD